MPLSELKRSIEEYSKKASLAKKILEDISDTSKTSRKYNEDFVEEQNLSAFWTLEEISRYELSCIFKKASERETNDSTDKEISTVFGVPPPPRVGASGGAKNPLTLDVTWQREARSSVKKNLQALREREHPAVLYNNCLTARQVEGDIHLLVTTPEPIPFNLFGDIGKKKSSKEDASASAVFCK